MTTLNSAAAFSLEQLRRAITIKEKIVALEAELGEILGVRSSNAQMRTRRGRRSSTLLGVGGRGTRTVSRATRGGNRRSRAASGRGTKRPLSARARAKLSAAATARWAKAKAAGRKSL